MPLASTLFVEPRGKIQWGTEEGGYQINFTGPLTCYSYLGA
jgi:hypothetical protein